MCVCVYYVSNVTVLGFYMLLLPISWPARLGTWCIPVVQRVVSMKGLPVMTTQLLTPKTGLTIHATGESVQQCHPSTGTEQIVETRKISIFLVLHTKNIEFLL